MYERILPTIQAIRNIQTLLRKTPMSHYIYRLFINFLLIHYFIYRLIRWSDPQYLPLCQKELCIRSPAVTRIAGNEFAVICFLWICYIVDDVTDCPTFCATLANMKRHDSCSCHNRRPSSHKFFSLNSLLLSLQ